MKFRGWMVVAGVFVGCGCASVSSAETQRRTTPETQHPNVQSYSLGEESGKLATLRTMEDDYRVSDGDTRAQWLQGLTLPTIGARWTDEIRAQVEYLNGHPDGRAWMSVQLKRMGRYEATVARVLKEEGLPNDLLYVVMVESGFNPKARSSRGAVGLWQLTAPVAKTYNLEMTHWVDRRMDPEQSTRVAARLLRDLHERFGSWELALAAYNMGYSALLTSIQKYNTNDFWHLARSEAGLPFETTMYVPKILACALVAANASRMGWTSVDKEVPQESKKVMVPGGLDLSSVAEFARVERSVLDMLNPELRRGRTPVEQEMWPIRVPAESYASVVAHVHRLKSDPSGLPSVRSIAGLSGYRVRLGDELDDIAYRFRTTTKQLQSWNDLKKNETLEPGVTILVPKVQPRTSRPLQEPLTVAVPVHQDEGRDAGSTRGEVSAKPNSLQRLFYKVVSGDTWARLSHHLKMKADDVRKWNSIDATSQLQPGMVLQLYVPRGHDLSAVRHYTERDVKVVEQGSDEFFSHHELKKGRRRVTYVVQPDDTLQSIGQRVGLSAASLARINRMAQTATLVPNQTLVVYEPIESSQAGAEQEIESSEVSTPNVPPSSSSTSASADGRDGSDGPVAKETASVPVTDATPKHRPETAELDSAGE
jgi:membrane-bound lytic murein transglycosylase D